MVRILCLHGAGSSADIFESQTASIRASLPSHWEWCFYDGEIECGPLPQMAGLYPGPFYTSFGVPTVKSLQEIHEWLLTIIEEDGPFDGAMGFSAGGCNILSLLLYMQKHEPLKPLPLRFLILMAGNMPFSGDMEEDGLDVTDWIRFHRIPAADLGELKDFNAWAKDNEDKLPPPGDLEGISEMLHPIMDDYLPFMKTRDDFFTKIYHPDVDSIRLQLPTCHVYGKHDAVVDGASKMVELCDAKRRQLYVFDGDHEVPRAQTDVAKIKDMIEKTVRASESMA